MADNNIPEDVSTMMTALVEYFEKQCEGEEYSEGLYRDLSCLDLPKELKDRVTTAIDNCIMRRELSKLVKKMYAGGYQPDSGEEKVIMTQAKKVHNPLQQSIGAPYGGYNTMDLDMYKNQAANQLSLEMAKKMFNLAGDSK